MVPKWGLKEGAGQGLDKPTVHLHPGPGQGGGSGRQDSKAPTTLLAAKAGPAPSPTVLSGQVCFAAGSGEGPAPGFLPQTVGPPSLGLTKDPFHVFHSHPLSLAPAPAAASPSLRSSKAGLQKPQVGCACAPTVYSDEEPGLQVTSLNPAALGPPGFCGMPG